MIDCTKFQDLVSAYVDDELDPEQKHAFDAHTESCPDCAEKLDGVTSLRASMRVLPTVRTTPDFDTVLRARIQIGKHVGEGTFRPLVARYGMPAFAVSIAALLLLMIGLHSGSLAPGTSAPLADADSQQLWFGAAPIAAGDMVYSMDIVPMPGEQATAPQPAPSGSQVIAVVQARSDSAGLATSVLRQQRSQGQQANARILSF